MERNPQRDIEKCRQILDKGGGTEQVLRYLKEAGYTQAASVFFLQNLGYAPSQAKRSVIESETWRANRQSVEGLHAALDEYMRSRNSDK